jgi:WD40 repeat protein
VHGHTGPVNSIDWSAAHADLLVSGGSDRCLRVCSLTANNLAMMGSMSCGTLPDQVTQGKRTYTHSRTHAHHMTRTHARDDR